MVPRPDRPTPVMSHHARQRCVEMGISTKVAKRIVQTSYLTYAGRPGSPPGTKVHLSHEHSEYAAVTAPSDEGGEVVLTVLFRTQEEYVRNGTTFIPAPNKDA